MKTYRLKRHGSRSDNSALPSRKNQMIHAIKLRNSTPFKQLLPLIEPVIVNQELGTQLKLEKQLHSLLQNLIGRNEKQSMLFNEWVKTLRVCKLMLLIKAKGSGSTSLWWSRKICRSSRLK